METLLLTILILAVVLGGFIFIYWQFSKKFKELAEKNNKDETALFIKHDVEAMRQRFDEGLSTTTSEINRRLDSAAKAYNEMTKELGKMQEIGRDMKSLQDFLRSPKLRGNLGEQVLKSLLEQVLPKKHYALQYRFREGDIVDAIIKTNQGIVSIDSKFPLENFRKMTEAADKEKSYHLAQFKRDIKAHIDAISKKYILPQEGTVDFAIMYVPSEAVYYEIVIHNENLLNYGYDKRVFFVSPNNFYYFLKIIMLGLEGVKIEEKSRQILEALRGLQHETKKFGEDLGILTNHINHTKSALERVNARFVRFSSKIDNVKLLEPDNSKPH